MSSNAYLTEFTSKDSDDKPMLALEQKELREELFGVLSTLSPEDQEVIALHHLAGMTLTEASAAAGINLNTFKARANSAMGRLRERLRPRARALEAYLAAVAVPPPSGGWDLAISRWTDVAGNSGATVIGLAALAKIALAIALPLAMAGAVWLGIEFGLSDGRSGGSAAIATPVVPDMDANPARPAPKAAETQPPDTLLYDPPAPALPGDMAQAGSSSVDELRHEVSPAGAVPADTVRTRRIYEDGRLIAEGTEIVTAAGALLDGPFKLYYPDGKLRQELYYRGGKPSGPFVEYHHNGVVAKRGAYVNDKMEGYWAMYDEEGWQSGEVTFINGLREGVVRMWHKNTLVRTEMPVLRGKPHGKKVEYSDRGDLIRSIEFEHGKKHGWDITIDPDGNKTAKYYQNGELVDPQPEYIEDEPTDKDG